LALSGSGEISNQYVMSRGAVFAWQYMPLALLSGQSRHRFISHCRFQRDLVERRAGSTLLGATGFSFATIFIGLPELLVILAIVSASSTYLTVWYP
jgi:hypothetical protein